MKLLGAILLFASISAQGQVKWQYQDTVRERTTVIVREDGTTDQDILNQQFDLDQFSMGQVIRITTGDIIEGKKESKIELVEDAGATAAPAETILAMDGDGIILAEELPKAQTVSNIQPAVINIPTKVEEKVDKSNYRFSANRSYRMKKKKSWFSWLRFKKRSKRKSRSSTKHCYNF